MDNQLVSLGNVPRHMMGAGDKLSLNAAARANMQASFAVLKIRGKNWRVRYRGEETLIQASAGTGHDGKPLPETPVAHVDLIVVGIAAAISKKWYAAGFADGESKAPDCFSVNGVSPDPASAMKQNSMCATCPQNIWGSSINNATGKKSKACRDGRRIAVVPAGDVLNEPFGGPMLIDIPPTSLASLDKYVRQLERMNADISQVITRVSFAHEPTHQELVFKGIGWIEQAEDYSTVIEHGRSDQVKRMLEEEVEEVTAEPGLGARPRHLIALPRPSPASVVAAPVNATVPGKPDPAPVTPPTPPATPPATASATASATPPAPPAPPPTPPAAAKAAPTVSDGVSVIRGAPPSLEADIASLLDEV